MSIYTDLALEARELNPQIPGITEENEEIEDISISRIKIENQDAAQRIGKAMGRYITIDAPRLTERDKDVYHDVSTKIASEITRLMGQISEKATILIIGLGNRYITPDSLGPRVAEKVYVTRHITQYMPEAIDGELRAVCSIAPGVLGVTGLETFEVAKGLAERLKPDLIIAIDSLASRRAARINTTVQLTDTGISPGSGVGNNRQGLTPETLGAPVLAIGIPLVVYASTISQDTISLIADETGRHNDEERLLQLAEKVISEHMGPMIVTPKDIDSIVEEMSGIVATAINIAVHDGKCEELGDLLM